MLQLHWTLLQASDVTTYLVQEQIALLTSFGEKPNEALLTNIIQDVCAYIQNRIPIALHPHPMAPNHLPDACKHAACHWVIASLQTRVPELKLSDDQVRNAEQAQRALEELYRHWMEEANPKRFEPRCEAVSYRVRASNHRTLKGL